MAKDAGLWAAEIGKCGGSCADGCAGGRFVVKLDGRSLLDFDMSEVGDIFNNALRRALSD